MHLFIHTKREKGLPGRCSFLLERKGVSFNGEQIRREREEKEIIKIASAPLFFPSTVYLLDFFPPHLPSLSSPNSRVERLGFPSFSILHLTINMFRERIALRLSNMLRKDVNLQ